MRHEPILIVDDHDRGRDLPASISGRPRSKRAHSMELKKHSGCETNTLTYLSRRHDNGKAISEPGFAVSLRAQNATNGPTWPARGL